MSALVDAALPGAPTRQAEMFAAHEIGPPRQISTAWWETKSARPALPQLDGDQLEAVAALDEFLASSRQTFCLQGLAGCGKTTVLAALARKRPNAYLVAPTGKAAAVLARKTGQRATTLHRLLYMPPQEDEDGRIAFREQKRWMPGELEASIALVDEASMVGLDLGADLLETGIRVIASGDPGQLPPVDEPPFFVVADFTLQQIRRQAEGSPIIRQAHRVREGLDYATDGEAFQIIDRKQAVDRLAWADVVLCWRNETRHRMNRFMRKRRGIQYDAPPQPGEPLMCLRNHASGIMNGEVFTVRHYDREAGITLADDRFIRRPWFEWRESKRYDGGQAPFALGYAITVHKSQGSEWPHVLILDEFNGTDRARWAYTAITRASAAVCIVRHSEGGAA